MLFCVLKKAIINGIKDQRINLINGPQKGLIKNFENAIKNSSGDIVFLSDQEFLSSV